MNKNNWTYHLVTGSLAILLMLSSVSTCAQSIQEELKQLNELYASGSHSYDFVYSFYSDKPGGQDMQLSGSIRKRGNNYNYTLGQSHMISNDAYILVADKENKVLLLDTVSAMEEMNTMLPIDSLFQYYTGMTREEKEGVIRYEMEIAWMGETKVAMTIEAASKALKKAELWITPNSQEQPSGKMVIQFSNVRLNTNLSPKDFQLDDYLKKVNGKLAVKSEYQHWYFLNHLNQ